MKGSKLSSYIYGIFTVLALWYTASMLLRIPIIPSPVDVILNLSETFYSKIMIHGLYSILRMVFGVLLSIIIGVPAGLCMGYYDVCNRLLSPVVYLTYPVPKIALLPIIMLVFGLGDFSKVFMILLIVIFQVIVAIRDGVKSIPEETYYPLYSLGAGHFDIFKEIIIPASLPKVLTSLRIAMATAISVLFFTETFGTQYGMGYFIMDAWMRVNYLEMYSGIIVLSMIGLVLFVSIDFLEKRFCSWR